MQCVRFGSRLTHMCTNDRAQLPAVLSLLVERFTMAWCAGLGCAAAVQHSQNTNGQCDAHASNDA